MCKINSIISLGAKSSTAEPADKVVGCIYETSNFDQFIEFPLNREPNSAQVKRIKEGILNGADVMLEHLLIIKMNDGTSLIGDGHTRVRAARELQKEGHPVKLRYVVRTEDDILKEAPSVGEFIQRLNNCRKAWTLGEMIQFYAKDKTIPERQEAYARLVELHNSGKYFPIQKSNWRYIAIVLFGGRSGAAQLKRGDCRNACSEADFAYYYKKLVEIASAMDLELKNNFVEAFIQAWFSLKKSVEYEQFIDVLGYKAFIDNLHTVRGDVKNSDADYWYELMASALRPRNFKEAE